MQQLGECLNYNDYGDSEADLIVHPATLYRVLHRYADPFHFIRAKPIFKKIRVERDHDLEMACRSQPQLTLPEGRVFILPDASWSRRVRGAYGNLLASTFPQHAHAVLTPNAQGGYTVSVRTACHHVRRGPPLPAVSRWWWTGRGSRNQPPVSRKNDDIYASVFAGFSRRLMRNRTIDSEDDWLR